MNKKSLLLFKNAFKQAFRNKIQLVGLVILVLLSSTIFSLMQTSLTRVSDEYTVLARESNIHDFIIDLSNTATIANPKTVAVGNDNINFQDSVINKIANIDTNQFQWDRVEARTMQLDNDGNSRVLKVIIDNSNARIDKLVISEGNNISIKNGNLTKQTVINKEFAQKNNLKIGDVIRVQKDELGSSLKVTGYDINDPVYQKYSWLKIVGFGTSADFTTPIIDQTTPIPNKTREGVLYVDPSNFGLTASKDVTDSNFQWTYDKTKENITITSPSDREVYFVGKSLLSYKNNLGLISNNLRKTFANTINSDAKLVYALGDSSYQFANRTNTLVNTISGFKNLLIALLLIVLIITGITVVLVTYKNIDNSRTQIGILKSLGYSNIKILITALAYPMVAAIIGTILVFLPASGLQLIVIHTFSNYFNLNFGSFMFNALGFLYCLILTFGFLSIIAWIISALTVIQNPIKLIKNDSPTTNSHFSRIVKKTSINRGFLTRFRVSLFTSSIGKMAAASLTMFLGTILMTTAIIGPKIMSDNKIVTYTGMNYKSSVEYDMPTYNSPYTFYKTYNPTLTPWKYQEIKGTDDKGNPTSYYRPDRVVGGPDDNSEFVKEILSNNINSEAYAPMDFGDDPGGDIMSLGMNSLVFLNGKMLTKSFLNGLDASEVNNSGIANLIATTAWPTVIPVYNLLGTTDNPPTAQSFYTPDNYNILRSFYQNYRSTIDMNLAASISSTNSTSTNPHDFDLHKFIKFASSNLPTYNLVPTSVGGGDSFLQDINQFSFNTSESEFPFHLQNEDQLLSKTATELSNSDMNNWINKVSIWFGIMFYGRAGQTVVQGAYSRSPYFIRQNIANAYKNPDDPFNVSFNVVPFDKDSDELGTYFTGLPIDKKFNGNQYPIKVYGLQNQQQLGKPSMMQLDDSNGNALNPLLEKDSGKDTTSIVINQTIAKQLNLTTNSEFTMSTNGNIMKYKDNNNKFTAFDPNQADFTSNGSGQPINNVTLTNQNTGFKDFADLKTGAYQNFGSSATPMLQDVVNNKVVNTYDKTATKYKVVGIYNGYGQPNAYISKTNADKLLNYNNPTTLDSKGNYHDTRSMLFQLFKQEWQNSPSIDDIDFSALKKMTYVTFLTNPTVDQNLIKLFDNENPLFNFKLSNSSSLPDMTNNFSTSQIYGDYSAFGLNGGNDSDQHISYEGYGAGSALNITPLYVHHQLLNQITALVDSVLGFFIGFSLIISFLIILLTSNLVIYENRKTIATMKTLGYSDGKITNIVMGMYLPAIVAMFAIGFPVGWVIVRAVINYLAVHTTWVLPLFFTWWLPVIVGIIVLGIYAATFAIDWCAMKKINPIKILSEID